MGRRAEPAELAARAIEHALERPRVGRTRPRVGKRSEEPRHRALVSGDSVRSGEYPRESILKKILGGRTIADTRLQATQERALVLDEHVERRR
jgi:hypothetical protein